jgi:hypothetical protein
MLEFQEYASGWLVYLLSVMGLLIVTWRLFRAIPWVYPRRIIFLTVLVLFVTPVLGDNGYWSPAWIVGSLEFLFGGLDSVLPILRIMLLIWLIIILLYTVIQLCFFSRGKKAAPTPRRIINRRVM